MSSGPLRAATTLALWAAAWQGGASADDVLSALVNLGYHRPLAEKAAEAAIKTVGSSADASFERVLKQALREVAK